MTYNQTVSEQTNQHLSVGCSDISTRPKETTQNPPKRYLKNSLVSLVCVNVHPISEARAVCTVTVVRPGLERDVNTDHHQRSLIRLCCELQLPLLFSVMVQKPRIKMTKASFRTDVLIFPFHRRSAALLSKQPVQAA